MRSLRLVKYAPSFDWYPVVMTVQKRRLKGHFYDSKLEEEIPPSTEIIRTKYSNFSEQFLHYFQYLPALIRKLTLLGKSWKDYSLDTVKMFYNDAQSSGYTL